MPRSHLRLAGDASPSGVRDYAGAAAAFEAAAAAGDADAMYNLGRMWENRQAMNEFAEMNRTNAPR